MKSLTLKDGTVIQFTDGSFITSLTTVVETFNEVEEIRGLMTEDNLSECDFDGVTYTDIRLDTVTTIAKDYSNVQATFFTKTTADAEIEALKQQVANLEAENAQLSDKAEAADILLGNEEV